MCYDCSVLSVRFSYGLLKKGFGIVNEFEEFCISIGSLIYWYIVPCVLRMLSIVCPMDCGGGGEGKLGYCPLKRSVLPFPKSWKSYLFWVVEICQALRFHSIFDGSLPFSISFQAFYQKCWSWKSILLIIYFFLLFLVCPILSFL